MRVLTRDEYKALCSYDYGERFLLMIDQVTWIEAAAYSSKESDGFVGSKIRFHEGYYFQGDMQEALQLPNAIAEASYFACDTSDELKAHLINMTIDLFNKTEFQPV